MWKQLVKEQRKYSPELKEEAIKMVIGQGLSQPEVALRLSIPKGTIGNWISKAKAVPGKVGLSDRTITDLAAENTRLRKDLATARMEREILRKATAYFAKESLPGTRS